jgi:hypothetical protein
MFEVGATLLEEGGLTLRSAKAQPPVRRSMASDVAAAIRGRVEEDDVLSGAVRAREPRREGEIDME